MRKDSCSPFCCWRVPSRPRAEAPYRILRTVRVGGDGGFDYVTADSGGRRLYMARSGKTNPRLLAFDLDSLKQAGEIDGISAHGAVVDPADRITALPAASPSPCSTLRP